jgi:hypothetical protein
MIEYIIHYFYACNSISKYASGKKSPPAILKGSREKNIGDFLHRRQPAFDDLPHLSGPEYLAELLYTIPDSPQNRNFNNSNRTNSCSTG